MSVSISILLALESSSDNVLFDQSNRVLKGLFVLTLLNTVQFSNTCSSLGSKSAGFGLVSESRNFLFSLFDQSERKGFDIGTDNAPSD